MVPHKMYYYFIIEICCLTLKNVYESTIISTLIHYIISIFVARREHTIVSFHSPNFYATLWTIQPESERSAILNDDQFTD